MKGLVVREANINDYSKVEDIMKQVQKIHVELRPDIYKPMEVVLPKEEFEESIKKDIFLVAEVVGEVCAVMILMDRTYNMPTHVKRRVLYVDTMAIDKAYRGNGIGSKLFAYVKKFAKDNKFDGIELQVNARNEVAKKMYEKCGFTEKSINMEITAL